MRKEEERRVRVSFCMFLKKRGENYKNRSENNNLNVLFLDCLTNITFKIKLQVV